MKTVVAISQLPIWDMKKNSGKVVMDKTFEVLSEKYNLVIIAPGSKRTYDKSKFYEVKNKLQKKTKNVKYIGHLLNYFYLIDFYFQVKRIIKKNNLEADIAYLIGPFGVFTGSRIFKKKAVIVNRYYGVAWNEKTFHTFKENVRFFLRKKCFRNFGDLVVMTNDGTKGDLFLEKIGCDKNKVLFLKNGLEMNYSIKPNFKNTFFEENNISDNTVLFLTVSRLAEWKKVDRAIVLISKLKKNSEEIKLVVVGDGEEMENLQKLTRELNVEDKVIFVGSISQEQLPNYYNIASVFLSLYNYSNAGNPLFEAMLHKKKIITIGNGDTKSFINSNSAIILEEYSEEVLYNAAKNIMLSNKLNNTLGINANVQLTNSFLSWDDRIAIEIKAIKNLQE